MELSTKLYILDDSGKKFMGAGVLWLLENIRETGSLLAASEKMGLSYSKARLMIDHLEESTGHAMVERHKGGADRKGAVLTEYAERYILLYSRFQEDAKADADERFREYLKELAKLEAEYERQDNGYDTTV